jgi:mannuronan 5-epimerase
MKFTNTVSGSGSGIEVDEHSYNNIIYDNTMIDIPDPSNALSIENGADSKNTFYSNLLVDIDDGNRIDLGEESMQERSFGFDNSNDN